MIVLLVYRPSEAFVHIHICFCSLLFTISKPPILTNPSGSFCRFRKNL